MALSLACSCGARFDVEDTVAGQVVRCPECQQAVHAPTVQRQPVRTSGFAVASVVLALVLAFTGFGTVLAVILGSIALVQIGRQRDKVAGTGYALFGIVSGLLLTGLFILAVVQTELFGVDMIREGVMADQVDRSGPLEISRPEDGFAIRRPSSRWGVANRQLAQEVGPDSEIVLAHIGKDAYIDVTVERLANRTLEEYRDQLLENYKDKPDPLNRTKASAKLHGLTVRSSSVLPSARDRECLEVLLDVNMGAQTITFLLHIVHPAGSKDVYVVRSWTRQRRFSKVENEFRQAIDSFRILP